jgi:MOSC domain-containing protein YiiM
MKILAVNVSRPKLLGYRKGQPVMSGIAKLPVTTGTITIGRLNLDGDGQADLRAHGGADKAVYVYPTEHLPAWRAELGYGDGPAPFGENLSTAGMVETEARIGDIWQWGTATLQVAQPRWPCYKLAMHSGNVFLIKHVVASRRTGWYLRVLEPGTAAINAPVHVTRDPAGLTVWDAFTAGQNLGPLALAERLADHPALADRLRSYLRQRIADEQAILA